MWANLNKIQHVNQCALVKVNSAAIMQQSLSSCPRSSISWATCPRRGSSSAWRRGCRPSRGSSSRAGAPSSGPSGRTGTTRTSRRGYSQIFRLLVFGPLGLGDYGAATLRCKIWSLSFLGLRTPPSNPSQSKKRKGSNFSIWQHWSPLSNETWA